MADPKNIPKTRQLDPDVQANTDARHDAVTVLDTAEIDLTLTGQQISAAIVASSIDETKLDASVNASLDLADSALQSSDIGVSVQAHSSVLDATTASFLVADESKLDGIAAGAEVNVQSDWNAVSGDALILNKPTIPTTFEKTRIFKRICGSGTQSIGGDSVVNLNGTGDDIADTNIVTVSGDVLTLKKTGGIYKMWYVIEGEMDFNLFGGSGDVKAEFERNDNGGGWYDIDESWCALGDIPRSGGTSGEFNLFGIYEITNSVANQTQIRLTAQNYSGPNWTLYRAYSKVVVEWTGVE